MRVIWRIVLFAAAGLWLYANFEILGLGTHYVHPMHILAFILQLAMIFVCYMFVLSNGKRDRHNGGRLGSIAEAKEGRLQAKR
jgi:hypothetical protein